MAVAPTQENVMSEHYILEITHDNRKRFCYAKAPNHVGPFCANMGECLVESLFVISPKSFEVILKESNILLSKNCTKDDRIKISELIKAFPEMII